MSASNRWSSNLAFILAATGAAVGLGNIWKFPYMAGNNGGSAFIVVYIVAIIVIGIPLLITEIALGKCARLNLVDSVIKVAKLNNNTKVWGIIGVNGAIALIFILSFYSVVSGWAIYYLFLTINNTFTLANVHNLSTIWQNFAQSPSNMLLWHTLFMFLTMGVVAMGVQAGLERASKIMLPFLYIILFILVFAAYQNGDFSSALHFLFDIKFAAITPQVLIDAMGHAFFTLAVGAGCMLTYGAYLPAASNILFNTIVIAILDVIVALLSGLAIFPFIFKYHLSVQEGPSLMFQVLPASFASISHGNLIGALFFLLLIFAAWTSSISLAEPLVLLFTEKLKISRIRACLLIGVCAWLLGIFSIFSFNIWHNTQILHRWGIFTFITDITTNIMLPLGGLGFAIFTGWCLTNVNLQQISGIKNHFLFKAWYYLIRYVVPCAIIIILLSNLIN